jgi:hypothetical protein
MGKQGAYMGAMTLAYAPPLQHIIAGLDPAIFCGRRKKGCPGQARA